MTVKIATCCYCGTRAALVLGRLGRQELACRACGAPLHEMKRLKAEHPMDGRLVPPSRVRREARRRSRPGPFGRLWREIKDEIEDTVEDIFDLD